MKQKGKRTTTQVTNEEIFKRKREKKRSKIVINFIKLKNLIN